MDGELAPGEAELLEQHIERCEGCAEQAEALATQGALLAELPPAPDPRLQDPAFWERMDRAIAVEWDRVEVEERSGGAVRARAARAPWWRAELRVSPVGMAAYGAALVLALIWGWSNLDKAEVAEARAAKLTEDLDRERRLASQPAAPPARVEAIRPASYTPRRGTL